MTINIKILDFLHKSKKLSGFLGKTKLSRAAYIEDCYGAEGRVLTTKLSTSSAPTSSIYAGSLVTKPTFADSRSKS
ncbi:hypothetical protein [Candidatus Tisiphia endosymbiont of Beris chalybata]|uniref:hypothetical protein n=1 Tax=Candidatus Tisiphia endosymbiont of Beris chalybata TaxID=3066262 RepID=UPI00312C7055